MRPARSHSAAWGGRTAPTGRIVPGQQGHACPSMSYTRASSFAQLVRYGTGSAGTTFRSACLLGRAEGSGGRPLGRVTPEAGADEQPDPLNAHATRGDDERTQLRRRAEHPGVPDLVLTRWRHQPGEPAHQGEWMQDQVPLSAPHWAAEGQAHAILIERLELRFGEGRPRDVEAELLPPLSVSGRHAHSGIDLPP